MQKKTPRFGLRQLNSAGRIRIGKASKTARIVLFVTSFAVVGIVTLLALRAAPVQPMRDRVLFGAYVPDLPNGRVGLPALEAQLGHKMQIASSFTDWSYIFGGVNDVWQSDSGQRQILYSWEPNGLSFNNITSGAQDAYLQRVADSMRSYPRDIYVRPWGEMNANWSTWQPLTPDAAQARGGHKPNGGTPTEFISAWRYTVNFFRSRGVNNLKFVFNPDASDHATNTKVSTIWPGAEYVDILGIDGYNWGATTAGPNVGARWEPFNQIFSNMYGQLTALHPTAPVWICEFGSKEPSKADAPNAFTQDVSSQTAANDKGVWWNELLGSTDFPRIKALAVFNVSKERDWRMESSASSLNAVKQQLNARTTTPAPPPPAPTPVPPPAPTPVPPPAPIPSGKPDLVVTDVQWTPAQPGLGQPVTFTATIKNQGTAATPQGVVHGVAFSSNGVKVSWADNWVTALAPNQSVTLTANGGPAGSSVWRPTVAGTHTIVAFVDDINRMPGESNEQNNTYSKSLVVASGTGWKGKYYDNVDYTNLKSSRIDPRIDFTWLLGAPTKSVGADTFSVRWGADLYVPTTGAYTFTTRSDDGARLWVANKQIINQWQLQSVTEHSATVNLTGGQRYQITMDFYDNEWDAVAQLYWSGPGIAKSIIPTQYLYARP